jgi:hypothetical protein
METIFALAQKDKRVGSRKLFGLNFGLSAPQKDQPDRIWLSGARESRDEVEVFKIGEVHYFDQTWVNQMDGATRYQIKRAQKRGVCIEIRRQGSQVPENQIKFVISEWKKNRCLPLNYLLNAPPIDKTLEFDCALLWRGSRLEAFAPLRKFPMGMLVENLYGRGSSLPKGSLPLLILTLIKHLQSEIYPLEGSQVKVSLGMVPYEGYFPKVLVYFISIFYNFTSLRKSRIQMKPLQSHSLYLNYPKRITKFKLALVLCFLLLRE